jgi:hypothetical protein
MNGFFLFNYLGRPNHKGQKESGNFIVKELNFNEAQLQQFNMLEDEHHKAMKAIGDDMKLLKDELFLKITASTVNESSVDSLIVLISEKDKLKEKELFLRLRGVYDLCNSKQKEQFGTIIKKARKFDNRGHKRPKKSE